MLELISVFGDSGPTGSDPQHAREVKLEFCKDLGESMDLSRLPTSMNSAVLLSSCSILDLRYLVWIQLI